MEAEGAVMVGYWIKKAAKAMFQGKNLPEKPDLQISEKMEAAAW